MEILRIELEDTVRSHWLNEDGTYHKLDLRGKTKLDSQVELIRIASEMTMEEEEEE